MDDMNYIDASIQEYKDGYKQFQKKMPDLGKKYQEFATACLKAGKLSVKQKQLLALGISIYAQDEYSIIIHTEEALKEGATEKEILETIGVCALFAGKSALSQGIILVQDVLKEKGQNKGQNQNQNQDQNQDNNQNQNQNQNQIQNQNQDQDQDQQDN